MWSFFPASKVVWRNNGRETFIIGFTDSGKFCGKQMGNPGVARINVTITTSSLPLRMFNTAEGGFQGVTNTEVEQTSENLRSSEADWWESCSAREAFWISANVGESDLPCWNYCYVLMLVGFREPCLQKFSGCQKGKSDVQTPKPFYWSKLVPRKKNMKFLIVFAFFDSPQNSKHV